jgi:hypothetical protein
MESIGTLLDADATILIMIQNIILQRVTYALFI